MEVVLLQQLFRTMKIKSESSHASQRPDRCAARQAPKSIYNIILAFRPRDPRGRNSKPTFSDRTFTTYSIHSHVSSTTTRASVD